jgi:hypothetical protein
MKNILKLIALAFLLVVAGCKTVDSAAGDKVKLFHGTIVYDVEVIQNTDTAFVKNKKGLYGTEMYLTVFKNGDIQRKYNGASSQGYDLYYIDVASNQILEKYNNSDSLYVHNAGTQNFIKLNDLRGSTDDLSILNYDLIDLSIGAQELDADASQRKYLTIQYWYADDIKIDKTKYTSVNDELWNYFINKSDGSLFLRYEIDYFTYKVVYTAKDIQPNKFERSKQKLGEEVPRIER